MPGAHWYTTVSQMMYSFIYYLFNINIMYCNYANVVLIIILLYLLLLVREIMVGSVVKLLRVLSRLRL